MSAIAVALTRSVNPFGVLFLLVATLVAVVAGAVAGIGFTPLSVLTIGGLLGLFLLGLPTHITLWGLIIFVFVVVGPARYFGQLSQILWVPFGIGLLLYFKLVTMGGRREVAHTRRVVPLRLLVSLFLTLGVISIVVNTPSPLQVVAGGKNLVAMWSIFFLLALGALNIPSIGKVWRFLALVAVFQVPLVLYQYWVIAPSRRVFGGTIGAKWDSIVGSFGGDPLGGGASGSMALFLMIVLTYAVAMYRRGLLGFRWLMLLAVATLGCIGLAEVKVVVVLIPIAVTVLFWAALRRRPALAFTLLIVGAGSVIGVPAAYERLHYAAGGRPQVGPVEVLEDAIERNADQQRINFRTGEMARMAALAFWWQENGWVDPVRTLVGHGPGASRSRSVLGAGDVAAKYPFNIARSAATQLLWEVGLVGLVLFTLILLRGSILAWSTSRAPTCSAETSAWLEATSAGLLMMVAMLPYSRDLLEVPAIAVLVMLLLGFSAYAPQTIHSPGHRL